MTSNETDWSDNPTIAAKQVEAIEQAWESVLSVPLDFSDVDNADILEAGKKLKELSAVMDVHRRQMFLPFDVWLAKLRFCWFVLDVHWHASLEKAEKPESERLKWHESTSLLDSAKSAGATEDECKTYFEDGENNLLHLATCLMSRFRDICMGVLGLITDSNSSMDAWDRLMMKENQLEQKMNKYTETADTE